MIVDFPNSPLSDSNPPGQLQGAGIAVNFEPDTWNATFPQNPISAGSSAPDFVHYGQPGATEVTAATHKPSLNRSNITSQSSARTFHINSGPVISGTSESIPHSSRGFGSSGLSHFPSALYLVGSAAPSSSSAPPARIPFTASDWR